MRVLYRALFCLILLAGGSASGLVLPVKTGNAQPETQPLPRPHTPPKNVRFDHLSDDLLNQTSAILQDSKGFMWFGSFFMGLFKYDGYTLRRSVHNPDDLHSLSSNEIQALSEDRDGVLWIGTRGGGLNRYNPETASFTRFRHDPDDPRAV